MLQTIEVEIIDRVNSALGSKHEIFRAKQRNGEDLVILNAADWLAIEETLYLNQVPGMVASIHAAAAEPLSFGVKLEDLEW